MRELTAASGLVVLVDDDVVPPGSISIGSHGYAQFGQRRVTTLLHRWLMGCTVGDGKVVDHINRDRLDCRRANLRTTDHFGNAQNRDPGPRRGAYPLPSGRWLASVRFRSHLHSLGVFDTQAEAQAVAMAWRDEHFEKAA